MKEITKNQATAIWHIFCVLWLTVGSIVCFNIHTSQHSLKAAPKTTPPFSIVF